MDGGVDPLSKKALIRGEREGFTYRVGVGAAQKLSVRIWIPPRGWGWNKSAQFVSFGWSGLVLGEIRRTLKCAFA